MCIDRDGDYEQPTVGIGYKVVYCVDSKYFSHLSGKSHHTKPTSNLPKRRWLHHHDFWSGDKAGSAGWHLLRTERDATEWHQGCCFPNSLVVIKVKYRGLRRVGFQQWNSPNKKFRVFTADEILILPEREKK